VSLLSPADTRALAQRLGVAPVKARGQNFLVDPNTVRRIVRLAELSTGGGHLDEAELGFGEHVLEIGPGLGSLTLGLLEAGARVTAVELDPALATALPRTAVERIPGAADRLAVVAGDALTVDVGGEPEVLAANLPYNVAVPILLRLLQQVPSLSRGVVMVQAEVAQRLAAPPGSRVYGVPSAKLAWYASSRVAAPVPRTVFWPQPRVDSALLTWCRRPPPAGDRRQTFAVIDAAFGQRRKMLRSALARWAGSAQEAERVLRAAGVDPGERGEQLAVSDFARIAAARRGSSNA
jgi:16S rRNA (adenine1518-N6/adenine1519-N6)-dimethyltransferase